MNRKLSSLAVTLMIATAFFIGGCQRQTENTHFYFVQITDTHFGRPEHTERTEKCVKSINKLPMPIECVVHTGDITADRLLNEKIVSEGKSILEKIEVPMHLLPGNHDILTKKLLPTVDAYKKHFGDLYSKAEYNGVVFLFVYSEGFYEKIKIDNVDALKWIEESLKVADTKPVIIFHHTPSAKDFYGNRLHDSWPKDMQAKWRKLINSYNVKAVITGHFHRDELHWLGNIPLYVSPPVAAFWGRQATYRIYEYNNGKIGYRTRYVED